MSTRVRGDQNSLFREESLSKKGELIHVQYPKSRIEFLHLSLMYTCATCAALLRFWNLLLDGGRSFENDNLEAMETVYFHLIAQDILLPTPTNKTS